MKRDKLILRHRKKLRKKYKLLIEEAYNFRQTDHALSDISEFKAIQLLDKLNKLKYLSR
ncbi:Lacal_2735 family protein [Lacinutrix sp. C3R15]|uniref:Lacal_2735 family protein n=1 Tax=Flavobacteriaceae TaxID=49546 RepID=UPI001C0817F0|nr:MULTISPECIES: Lacal_2735 family protein [Flavobacteriaceae]MBU2940267.1 Lacal_2735 family protein [Lacinutrix sp. C3R15]MDO6623586.1 Lacal_2735 family protein [Oceanihabitans sp. 1_MG-2023]